LADEIAEFEHEWFRDFVEHTCALTLRGHDIGLSQDAQML
jgi:hypothetical protein